MGLLFSGDNEEEREGCGEVRSERFGCVGRVTYFLLDVCRVFVLFERG